MTVFTKIINGDLPCYKIAENDLFIAFLDIEPLTTGHTLVVPKVEVDKVYDLDDNYLKELMIFAKPIAKAIEKAFDCKRCGFTIIGLEVPHAHLHLLPISAANDINFTKKPLSPTSEELLAAQKLLISAL